MTQLLEPQAGVRPRAPSTERVPTRRRRSHSTLTVFLTACVAYLVAGWQLAIEHHAIVGDAMARVANGSYVFFSRDPHLAAVGFVWNPLPSFAALPFVALSPWFPALRTQAFAGNIVSVLFMAGSVATVWRILEHLAVGRLAAIGFTLTFGLHPLILEYGANGDSEAALVFFLALTCLGVLLWLDRRDLHSLMLIGAALAFGYLSRQEFLAAGFASLTLIFVSTYRDEVGTRRHRRWAAATEAGLAGMPFGLAIICWAGSAFVIVGTATSYLAVNKEQVDLAQTGIASVVGGNSAIDRLSYYLGQLILLEPLWSVILLVSLVVAWRARDRRILAPLVTFGAVVGAQGTLFGAGSTFGWLRFAITLVPLTVVCAGVLVARVRVSVARPRAQRLGQFVRTGVTVAVLTACAIAIPSAARAMATDRWGREEAATVHLLPGFGWLPVGHSYLYAHNLDGYDDVARYFDRRDIPDGSVLTDAQYTFPLMLKSERPQQFVIPSDFDFERSVADPATYRIRYLLITNGSSDMLRRAYPIVAGRRPTIPIGSYVRSFSAGPQTLYLFRVTRSFTG